jgi:hypothetical protein
MRRVQMSDAHGSAGALGSFLHDPFFDSDDLLFPERLAYPESVGVCSDLGPDSASFVSSFLPHEALTETCHTHIDTGTIQEVECFFRRVSATKEAENGTAQVSLAALEPEATCAAQRLLDLPTAAETRMQKLRAKNRRNQLAYRTRLKVTLPTQPCTCFCAALSVGCYDNRQQIAWRRSCVNNVVRLHLLVTLHSAESQVHTVASVASRALVQPS